MDKLDPADIVGVVAVREQLNRRKAESRARARGLRGAKVDAAGERAVQRTRKEPTVTADLVEDGLRFWSRLYLAEALWKVEGTLARDPYGRTVVSELSIAPWPGEPIMEPTANVLRSLSVTTLRERVLEELRRRDAFVRRARMLERAAGGGLRLEVTEDEEAAIMHAAELAGPSTPRRGRHGGGDEFYRAVAGDAVRVAAAGLPVYRTLASERGVTAEAARKWIARSRTLGFLVKQRNVWQVGPNYNRKEDE